MTWVVVAILIWLAAWAANHWMACSRFTNHRLILVLAPVLFGLSVLALWEGFVRGLGVSPVILPPPSVVAARFMAETSTLWEDFVQTVAPLSVSQSLVLSDASTSALAVIDLNPDDQRILGFVLETLRCPDMIASTLCSFAIVLMVLYLSWSCCIELRTCFALPNSKNRTPG